MDTIRFQKNTLTEKIESIDYTHLLGYPSEVVAAEVITLVKDVVSDHMDKIVEQLEENWQIVRGNYAVERSGYFEGKMDAYDRAIEIVKGGAV